MKNKINGFIFYKGPSLIDGFPVVGIAILNSQNSKTGNMIQTYIINDNGLSPLENSRQKKDYSICGNCKHRRNTGGSCYVNLGQGPNMVFKSLQANKYPDYTLSPNYWDSLIEGREIRIGAYGDPMAIPYEIWERLLNKARNWTGYTHQWNEDFFDSRIGKLCMASVDNKEEYTRAKDKGLRTFRVLSNQESTFEKEFFCPATPEGNNKTDCKNCCACSGTKKNPNKADVAVVVHGSLKARFTESLQTN